MQMNELANEDDQLVTIDWSHQLLLITELLVMVDRREPNSPMYL
jgi:hypothetical protein